MQTIKRSLSGKTIPASYKNQSVQYTGGSTVAEIISAGHAENEDAIVRVFYGGHKIAGNQLVTDLALAGATLEQISAAMSRLLLPAKLADRKGGNPEGLAKAHAARVVTKERASKMEALLEAAKSNPELAALLASLEN